MEFRDFTAGKDDDGRRLDRLLRIFLSDTALGEIYKLLRKGLIKLNNKKAKPEFHVKEGDIISIAEFLLSDNNNNADKASASLPQPDLSIIFENEHLLIIDKPYGLSVHGSEAAKENGLNKAVTDYYKAKFQGKSADSLSFRPGPLHRLDRNTSGLLVFSMSLEGARYFSESIKNHTVQKRYYGLAEGKLEKEELWEDKLSDSDIKTDGFYTVSQNDLGKPAQTSARPLAYGSLNGQPLTLVEYSIKTGRKHQIRAQSQLHGHPLAGDRAYGGKQSPKLKREYYLQAFCLTFPENNPLGLPCEIKMGLSPDFIELLQYCEIKNPGL